MEGTHMNLHGNKVVMLWTLALFMACGQHAMAQVPVMAPAPRTLHVNVATGDDAGPGSMYLDEVRFEPVAALRPIAVRTLP